VPPAGRRVVASRRHGVEAPRGMVRATAGVKVAAPALVVVPRRRRAVGLAVVLSSMIGVAMLGAAAFQTQLARRQLELDSLDREISTQREFYDVLRRERAELRSPARLAQIAASTGMVPARDNAIDTIGVDIEVAVKQSTGLLDQARLDDGTTLLEQFRVVKAVTDGRP
jgi:cell division protein FtsL